MIAIFIMNELGKLIKKEEKILQNDEYNDKGEKVKENIVDRIPVSVIAQNAEKYMAFYINNNLAFIDSLQFMNSSLAKLASNLSEDDFIYTKKYFTDPVQFNLMTRKGVYPYDFYG